MEKSCLKGCFCSKAGFTLIELLVVVLIIGILAAVALPQYTKAVEKVRLSEALTVVNSLEKAIDLWVLEGGFSTSGEWWYGDGQPSSRIFFLGDESAYGKGRLALDIENSLDCSMFGTQVCNKNFRYDAFCDDDGTCTIQVVRRQLEDDDNDEILYIFTKQRDQNGTWSTSFCFYLSGARSYGENICKAVGVSNPICGNCE